jgi:hypothetical protein
MRIIRTLLIVPMAVAISIAWPASARAQTKINQKAAAAVNDKGWPRKFDIGGSSFAVYQPQLEEWIGNRWAARAAFSVSEGQAKHTSYGVLWFVARAEIDKVNRLVTFSDVNITKLHFPSAPERAAAYQSALQARAERRGEVISLDRLLADMATNQAETGNAGHDVKNDPPQVFFSTRPAILILVDGNPELRPIKDTKLERVINTRVLVLRDQSSGKFYLHLMDGWLEAGSASGPWSLASSTPEDLNKALEMVAGNKQVDLLQGSQATANAPKPSLKDAAKQNQLPDVFVSTGPAELLQTQGQPEIASIEGTQLVYVVNTQNDIFVYTPTQDHYILIAGRWFRTQTMKGPWEYVPGDKLPEDFAQIPSTHAKANVLVSVAGTPEAKEALIANSVPQTATITRSAATLTVNYDGAPRFKPIENTTLQYAVNTPVPVIAVDSQSYYAVQNGVWFVATSPTGPWVVATSVPAVIYSIPLGSPLHYVTYVKIYGSTPEAVYVGYTPGYYGTVVSSSNVVVYGTGWYYPPYVGTYWYGWPYTYGCGAAFTWGVATGWGLAYGYGYAWSSYYYPAPWWGPVGYAGVAYYGAYGWGGVAATNVYGQWGNVAYSGTKAAWANPYTGNVGRGGVVTGTNTVTGTRYAARGGTNTNVYTGTTVTGGGAVAYNPNTGRISAGQAGTVTNAYTGNSAAGTRGVSYNPQTGVISGGSVGGVRNASTGQVTAGGSAFAYNPKTNTGVAVANNNVYAGKDGNIYRYNQSTGVQQRTDSGWQNVQRQQDRSWVQNQQQARSLGQQRTQSFGSARGNLGASRPNFGGGGGFRGRRR